VRLAPPKGVVEASWSGHLRSSRLYRLYSTAYVCASPRFPKFVLLGEFQDSTIWLSRRIVMEKTSPGLLFPVYWITRASTPPQRCGISKATKSPAPSFASLNSAPRLAHPRCARGESQKTLRKPFHGERNAGPLTGARLYQAVPRDGERPPKSLSPQSVCYNATRDLAAHDGRRRCGSLCGENGKWIHRPCSGTHAAPEDSDSKGVLGS